MRTRYEQTIVAKASEFVVNIFEPLAFKPLSSSIVRRLIINQRTREDIDHSHDIVIEALKSSRKIC
jgi:hypothetical protein